MDDILARAKLLAQAANQVADQMTMQIGEYKAVVDARKADEASHAAIEATKKTQRENDRTVTARDLGSFKVVKGAAINGSSLVNTYEDIRSFAPRGSTIIVDDVVCKLKENGQWTASRVELVEDFAGATNLDAEIKAQVTSDIIKRNSPKKNRAVPVSSSDIMGAVAGLGGPLNTARSATNGKGIDMASRKKLPRKKKRPADPTSSRSPFPTPSTLSSLVSQHQPHRPSSPTHSTAGTVASTRSSFTVSSTVAHSPPKHSAHLPVTVDSSMEPAQIQMAAEIESLSPETQRRMRIDMNVRMADRGQQKAAERVAQRKQLQEDIVGFSESEGATEVMRGQHLSEDMLDEQRRLALQRVAEKRKEEDRAIAEALRAEEEERNKLKKRMEAKAEQLKKATAERVAAYKAAKREKIRKGKEEEAQAMALKREREAEYQSEMHLQRLQARARETEARLQKQKKESEEKKYVEKLLMEEKLAALAAERQRTKNVVGYREATKPLGSENASVAANASKSKPRVDVPSLEWGKSGSNKKKISRSISAAQRDNPGGNAEASAVVVSVQSGNAASFLPAIRTSTSEQSARVHPLFKSSPQASAKPPISPVSSPVRGKSPTGRRPSRNPGRPPLMPAAQQRPVDEDDDDDFWSDDSLQKEKKPATSRSRQQEQDEIAALIGADTRNQLLANIDNMSCVSALTMETATTASFGTTSDISGEKKKRKKKKKEVWKMQPISVKPYVPVPESNKDIRSP